MTTMVMMLRIGDDDVDDDDGWVMVMMMVVVMFDVCIPCTFAGTELLNYQCFMDVLLMCVGLRLLLVHVD